MASNYIKRGCLLVLMLITCWLFIFSGFAAASGTHTPVTGVTVSVSGATDNSMTNGAVTVTAKGSNGVFGFGASTKTATITIYNDSGNTGTLSFNWVATSINNLVIDGTTQSNASGPFRKEMAAGASITITITTAKNDTENKLVMSGFVLASGTSKVTFEYDDSLGGVSVAGNSITNGTDVGIEASGVEIKAIANSGATFLGWIDKSDNKLISRDAIYPFVPPREMTVKAVFTTSTSNAWFRVGTDYMFETLTEACTFASTANNKTIVPVYDGVLPAGNYTIRSGVTLLIPFDDSNTLYTTEPGNTTSYVKPSAYRTLTMAKGAHIVVNGKMSLSAKHFAAGGGVKNAGSPSGKVSFVNMQDGSSITVNSGGGLYVYGYITGAGTVTVNSGATVYENFQVMDYRGGTECLSMLSNNPGVFFLSQYYIQNIEVPTMYYSGAKEYCMTSLNISIVGVKMSTVNFIGSGDAMFNLTSGTMTKRYDGATDRLVVDIDGELNVSSIALNLAGYNIESKNYELPINGNLTININATSAVELKQDMAMLPGSKINVAETATFSIGSNNLYVYDAAVWGGYCGAGNAIIIPLDYAPGRTGTRSTALDNQVDASILVNGTVTATSGGLYTTAGGANIYSTGNGVVNIKAGSQTVTYQRVQGSTYPEIAITPAQLKHEDGTYQDTSGITETTTYYYKHHDCEHGDAATHGKWSTSHTETTTTVDATCTDAGSVTRGCSCSHSYTETISASGHSMGDWVVTDRSTATIQETQTCSSCSHNETRSISAVAYTAAVFNGTAGVYHYAALQEAVDNTTDNYITMESDTTEDSVQIKTNTYINLNGQNIEANITVASGCTLYGMDTATDDLVITTDANGRPNYGVISGTVTGTVSRVYNHPITTNSSRLYVYCSDDSGISFHRVRFGVSSYTYYLDGTGGLRDALTITATYAGDAKAISVLENAKKGLSVTSGQTVINGKALWATADATEELKTVSNETETVIGYAINGYLTGVVNKENPIVISAKAMLEISGVHVDSNSTLTRTVTLDALKEVPASE